MGVTFQVLCILLFTASDFTSITSHIHDWVLFLLWLHLFILSGVISLLFFSSILSTYWPAEFMFQCHVFLPFCTVYGVLKARILKWFAIPSPVDHVLSDLSTMTHPLWVAYTAWPTVSLSQTRLWSMWSLSQWCQPIISSSVIPFSSCLQSFLASGSFPMSWHFTSVCQIIGTSASILPMTIQGWFPLWLTGLISLLSKRLLSVFSSTAVQKHQFFGTQPALWPDSVFSTWLLGNYSLD